MIKSTARLGTRLSVVACSFTLAPDRLAAQLGDIGHRLGTPLGGVVVSNGAHPLPAATADWCFIQGSNDDLEFSAYREGLAWLQRDGGAVPEAVLFANDTLFTKHHARRLLTDLLRHRALLESVDVAAIAGKTDSYDNVCHASPWSGLPVYVSTFCFLLNQSALPALATLGAQADADLGSRQLDPADPAWGTGLTAPFRAYLRAHLLHAGNSLSWYQLARHGSDRRIIARKARSVYSEHRLSGEIGVHGVLIALYPRLRMRARFFLFEQWAKLRRRLHLPA